MKGTKAVRTLMGQGTGFAAWSAMLRATEGGIGEREGGKAEGKGGGREEVKLSGATRCVEAGGWEKSTHSAAKVSYYTCATCDRM